MKIKALQGFWDLNYKDTKTKKWIDENTEYEVSEERAKVLTSTVHNGRPLSKIIKEQNKSKKESK